MDLKAVKQSAHGGEVKSIKFSPDGKKIVSGSNDKMIKVWDAGEPFQLCPVSLSRLHHTLLPADSLTLIKEKQNVHMSGRFGSFSSVQFSPDGTKIVSGGIEDKMLKVWDSGEH